jgi:hypothetical protein
MSTLETDEPNTAELDRILISHHVDDEEPRFVMVSGHSGTVEGGSVHDVARSRPWDYYPGGRFRRRVLNWLARISESPPRC